MALKDLEIKGKFTVDGILKGLGQTVSAVGKAKLEFQSMQTGVQSNLNAIGQKVVELSNKQQQAIKDLANAKKDLNSIKPNLDNELVSKELAKQRVNELRIQVAIIKEQQRETKALLSIETQQAQMKVKMAKAHLQEQIEIERQLRKNAKEGNDGSSSTFGRALSSGTVSTGIRSVIAGGVLGAGAYTGGRIATKALMDDIALDREMVQVNNAAGAYSSGTQGVIKNRLLGSSSSTGVDAIEFARMQSQLLSTMAFSPGREGDAGYEAKLKKAQEVGEKIALGAKASGASMNEYMDAVTYTATATGMDLRKDSDFNKVADLLAYTQKMGKGTMSETAQAFSKIMPNIGSAGMSQQEAAGTYAAMTNIYSPAMAATATQHFMKLKAEAPMAQKYMTGALNSLYKSTGGQMVSNDADNKKLLELRGKGVRNMWLDAQGNAKPYADILKGIKKEYDSLETVEAKGIFKKLFAKGDSVAGRVLSMITNDATDENGNNVGGADVINKIIEGSGDATGSNQKNIDNLNNSISHKWNQMTQTWKNGMIGFVNNAEPVIGKFVDTLTLAGSKLPAIGEILRKMAGELSPEERKAIDETRGNNEATGNISGVIPKRHFNLTMLEGVGLRNDLVDLASTGGGEGRGIKGVMTGRSAEIWDKISSGEELPKEDFMKFFGKNASSAANKIQSRVAESGVSQGALGYFNEMPSRAIWGNNATTNPSEYADAMGSIARSIEIYEKNNAVQERQEMLQEKMLQQLGIIANKNFGGGDVVSQFLGAFSHKDTGSGGSSGSAKPLLNSIKPH